MSASYKFKLKPALSEIFPGIIWKVETDTDATVVAIESRDINNRTTYFSAFDYSTGRLLFQDIKIDDGWFWSLDRVHQGMVFLHSYVHENSPEHKGIVAIDSNGHVAWQQFHKTLHAVSSDGIVVYNPKIYPKILELAAPQSGEVLAPKVHSYSHVNRDIILPDILIEQPDFAHALIEDVVGPILHSKVHNTDILAFHSKDNVHYAQQIAVYQDGNLVLHDYLSEGIQKLNPEAFFIEQNHLLYIRNNKRQFVSYLV